MGTKDDAAVSASAEPVHTEINALKSFIDRRISELSVELFHTFERLDDAEVRMAERVELSTSVVRQALSEVISRISRITQVQSGKSNASSGSELELAVQDSERSADTILSAAERLSGVAAELSRMQDPELKQIAQSIADDVALIFEASSFQDLSGQRVRGAIRVLEEVRQAIVISAGISDVSFPGEGGAISGDEQEKMSDQSDIDQLFG